MWNSFVLGVKPKQAGTDDLGGDHEATLRITSALPFEFRGHHRVLHSLKVDIRLSSCLYSTST